MALTEKSSADQHAWADTIRAGDRVSITWWSAEFPAGKVLSGVCTSKTGDSTNAVLTLQCKDVDGSFYTTNFPPRGGAKVHSMGKEESDWISRELRTIRSDPIGVDKFDCLSWGFALDCLDTESAGARRVKLMHLDDKLRKEYSDIVDHISAYYAPGHSQGHFSANEVLMALITWCNKSQEMGSGKKGWSRDLLHLSIGDSIVCILARMYVAQRKGDTALFAMKRDSEPMRTEAGCRIGSWVQLALAKKGH